MDLAFHLTPAVMQCFNHAPHEPGADETENIVFNFTPTKNARIFVRGIRRRQRTIVEGNIAVSICYVIGNRP
jgi:hypothetical protein